MCRLSARLCSLRKVQDRETSSEKKKEKRTTTTTTTTTMLSCCCVLISFVRSFVQTDGRTGERERVNPPSCVQVLPPPPPPPLPFLPFPNVMGAAAALDVDVVFGRVFFRVFVFSLCCQVPTRQQQQQHCRRRRLVIFS